ncbi:MAG: hypothetical protein U0903_13855 [Planctomycetales bacterium]
MAGRDIYCSGATEVSTPILNFSNTLCQAACQIRKFFTRENSHSCHPGPEIQSPPVKLVVQDRDRFRSGRITMSRVYVSLLLVLVCTLVQFSVLAAEKTSASESSPDPVLEKILKAWEQASRQRKSVTGKFQKFSYDRTFAVENRATGSFATNIDKTGVYQVDSTEIPQGTVSRRLDSKGRPYQLKSDKSERMEWTSKVFRMTSLDGSIEEVKRPAESKAANTKHSWLSWYLLSLIEEPVFSQYLLGISEKDLKERFNVSLVKQTPNQIHLSLLPRHERDKCNFSEVQLMLNKKDYTLAAIRMIDPPETKETVHVFEDIQVTTLDDQPDFELCLQP